MPNIVSVNGEQYFVIDMKEDKKGNITYLLDNGKWVKAIYCEIVD